MSEESKFDFNIAIALAIIAVITSGWFVMNSGDTSEAQVATIAEVPTEVVPVVATILNDEVIEVVVVTADPINRPRDEESNNTDIANAENAE